MAASGSVVGALRVVLGMDSASLERGLKNSRKGLKQFGESAKKIGIAIGVALAGAAAALAVGVKKTITEMDKLAKLSKSLSVPVEELSKLRHAAELSGTSFDAVSKGIARLSRNMVEAEQGLQTPIRAFKALGVEVRDGNKQIKTVSQILPELADAFKNLPDGPQRAALQMQLLGRAGVELGPLLNSGSDAIRAMFNEAEQLGLVIDKKTAAAAERFDDNLTRLGSTVDALKIKLATFLLPSLEALSDSFVNLVKDGEIVQTIATKIVEGFLWIQKEVTLTKQTFENFGRVFSALGAFLSAVTLKDYADAWEGLKQAVKDNEKANTEAAKKIAADWEAAHKRIQDAAIESGRRQLATWDLSANAQAATQVAKDWLETNKTIQDANTKTAEMSARQWDGVADGKTPAKFTKDWLTALSNVAAANFEVTGKFADRWTAAVTSIAADAQRMQGEIKNIGKGTGIVNTQEITDAAAAADRFKDAINDLKLNTRELRGEFGQLAPGFIQAAQSLDLIKGGADNFSGSVDGLTPKMAMLNSALWEFKLAQLTQDELQPWDELNLKMQMYAAMLEALPDKANLVRELMVKAALEASWAWAEGLSTVTGNFAQAFAYFGKTNKKMFEIGKAFATAQAIINTYLAVTKAFASSFPPVSYALAASALAFGLAQVAQIQAQQFTAPSTSVPGGAKGGSFMVGGGISQVDTRIIPLALAPGERVDVTPANQANGGGDRELVLSGIRPKDFFTGDTVREMISAIDQWIKDGGTGVKFAT